ncbi:MAG: hypothetical protein AAGG48_23220 [Planctomycetota bacterium]
MNENPYQPPMVPEEKESADKTRARRSFRLATVILWVPAVYNYLEFDAIALTGLPGDVEWLYRSVNVVLLLTGFVLLWFIGLNLVERTSLLLHRVFASHTDVKDWQETLYRSVPRIVRLALFGAGLWLIWIVGFYRMDWDFYTLSWVIGVPAHALAACWYLPLLVRWYQLVTSASRGQGNESQA